MASSPRKEKRAKKTANIIEYISRDICYDKSASVKNWIDIYVISNSFLKL